MYFHVGWLEGKVSLRKPKVSEGRKRRTGGGCKIRRMWST